MLASGLQGLAEVGVLCLEVGGVGGGGADAP